MKITVLMNDNKKSESNLINEHGLSLLIEKEGKYLIYDTGLSKNTYVNIEKLNLSSTKIDYIILSHGHYDHVGGLDFVKGMLKENGKIIVGNKFFENNKKYHLYKDREKRFIGNELKKDNLYIEVRKRLDFGEFEIVKMESEDKSNIAYDGLAIEKNGYLLEDKFEEEIALLLKGEKNVLITGCTHNNLFNLINKIGYNIDVIVGGLHYKNKNVNDIEEFIKKSNYINNKKLYLMHCTGENLIKELKKNKFDANEVFLGDEIKI